MSVVKIEAGFGGACNTCAMRSKCVSPTSILSDDRKYMLKLMGYKQSANEIMLKGSQAHMERQTGIMNMQELGASGFMFRVVSGKEVEVCEVGVCSPTHGLRGFLDIMKMRWDRDKNELWIKVTELKSGSNIQSYMMQMACYGMVMSDKKSFFYMGESGTKKELNPPFPIHFIDTQPKVTIELELEIFGQDQKHNFMYMQNNEMSGRMELASTAFVQKVENKRKFHEPGEFLIGDTDACKWCRRSDVDCDLWTKICRNIPQLMREKSDMAKMIITT